MTLDILLAVLGGLLVVAGIAGCIIPGLPGPPLGFAGLLCLHFTRFARFPIALLVIFGLLAGIAQILDTVLPGLAAKKFGGSKRAVTGAALGTLAGLFVFPPLGIIVGSFAGAFLGELTGGRAARDSLRASWGAFLGFVTGTAFKVMIAGLFLSAYIIALVS